MCFSVQADVAVGVVLVPVAVAALREVKCGREVPFALLPGLFALHQFVEVFVWLGFGGHVGARVQSAAALAYLVFALPVLPVLMPLAVLLLEPRGSRLRVAPFVALGVVVATYLAYALAATPIEVVRHPHALQYVTLVQHGTIWALLYVSAVVGPALMSGYPSIIAFGILNLLGLIVVALLLVEAFDSLWCVYAALASTLVVVHMRRRRRLPDPHRLEGRRLSALPQTRV